MKRGLVAFIAAAAAVVMLAVPSAAQERFPVSVGITYGTFGPSLDAYNLRYIEQTNPITVTDIFGVETTTILRNRLDSIDSTVTLNQGSASEFTTGRQPFLFSSEWGIGLQAKVRLHSELYALVESDWWKQEVGSTRKFGPSVLGYEANEVSLNPITGSLIFDLPTEPGNRWFPQFYVGGGAGVVLVERTTTQVTTSAPVKSTSAGSGLILTGLAGAEYPFWFLNNRMSLFFEGRYLTGGYTESFPSLDINGVQETDAVTGEAVFDNQDVSIQGAQMKFGMSVNFGQIRTRAARGVLSGLIESRSRRGAGYAMAAPTGYGAPVSAGVGLATVYAQPSDQVQVVQGAAQIDENRIRQIIREELLSARVTSGGVGTAPVDDLAEQQLRSIRERRLQAEQELEQLKELLREEG